MVALTDATDQTAVQQVADSLAPLRNGDAAAVAGVKDIEVLNAHGKADEVLSAIKYIDSKITYRLTGQTLSTDNQEYGSRSMGDVHQKNALFYAKSDALQNMDRYLEQTGIAKAPPTSLSCIIATI